MAQIQTSLNISQNSFLQLRQYRHKIGHLLNAHMDKLNRLKPTRECATRYNRHGRNYKKVSIRLLLQDHILLRHCSQSLRISASRIIDALFRTYNTNRLENFAIKTNHGTYQFDSIGQSASDLGVSELWIREAKQLLTTFPQIRPQSGSSPPTL